MPSTRSRTDSLVRPMRLAMSLTETRSWSTRSGTAVGTALLTLSTSYETAAAGPGARTVALTVVTPSPRRRRPRGALWRPSQTSHDRGPRTRRPPCRCLAPQMSLGLKWDNRTVGICQQSPTSGTRTVHRLPATRPTSSALRPATSSVPLLRPRHPSPHGPSPPSSCCQRQRLSFFKSPTTKAQSPAHGLNATPEKQSRAAARDHYPRPRPSPQRQPKNLSDGRLALPVPWLAERECQGATEDPRELRHPGP